MKYPVGIQSFRQIREDGYVYVDKTDLVYSLATEGKIYFLSRPRRFGKSLLVSTLENYFLGRKELFKGLKIESLEKDWKTYPVFHIDFNSDSIIRGDALQITLESYVSDWEKAYGVDADEKLSIGRRFAKVLAAAHRQTGMRCVVLVDEYDKPLLDVMGLPDTIERNNVMVSLEDFNREVLKGFYSTFKQADDDLQFVLLTGVTKFSQVSVFSGFNQPKDISMRQKYETLCGISEAEIDSYFRESIMQMAELNHCSYDKMRASLRRRYDGYHFGEDAQGIYNPYSLLNALDSNKIKDYWFETGTPSYLVRLLEKTNENLDELAGKYFAQNQFENYRADSQLPLPMIFQSGYLTIKAYKSKTDKYLLDFPNDEVKKGFASFVADSYLKTKKSSESWVGDLVDALEDGNLDQFRTLFTSFLASIPYTVRRKEDEHERERHFTYTLYLIFRIASCYVTYAEKAQSQGRLDCVVETDKHVYIFEFKLDGTAAEALKQIDSKGYATEYLASGKTVHKIGLSISSETGTVEDWGEVVVG